ncbi:MAG TPA: hypothetical protein VN672_06990 [Solirubrobacteraceae bacterium]|nr:hypothetical protein [Solirubrobacteraceae bacterium]
MPTFCRHGRFLERCPICSKTLPGAAPANPRPGAKRRTGGASRATPGAHRAAGAGRGNGLRVRRQERAVEDGYTSPLLPGLRASADAARLAEELAFSNGRLCVLAGAPDAPARPQLYEEVHLLAAAGELERASWICFLIAYLRPLEGEDPFAGISLALASESEGLPELSGVPLGPRSSHDPARGAATLRAYRSWYGQAARSQMSSQAQALIGDPEWSPTRRFERLFERLALPGLTRAARYELLVLLGGLDVAALEADSLHLSAARGSGLEDATTLACKRVFGIGDPLLLERRARALAEAVALPIAALELALANWQEGDRVTLGFPPEAGDYETLQRARTAFGL